MIFIPTTSAEFEAWRDQHPGGYIINAHKQHGFPMYWHQAGYCGHLTGPLRWVEGEFFKACSLNPGELAIWTKGRSEELLYCKDCESRWEKENPGAKSS